LSTGLRVMSLHGCAISDDDRWCILHCRLQYHLGAARGLVGTRKRPLTLTANWSLKLWAEAVSYRRSGRTTEVVNRLFGSIDFNLSWLSIHYDRQVYRWKDLAPNHTAGAVLAPKFWGHCPHQPLHRRVHCLRSPKPKNMNFI